MAGEARTVRRVRIALAIAALLFVAWIAWIARGALFPFLLGTVVAYLLAPLVERLAHLQPWYGRHPEQARGAAVLGIYSTFLGLIVLALVFLVPQAVDEIGDFVDSVPELAEQAQTRVERWVERYNEEVPEEARRRINDAVERLGTEIGGLAEAALERTVGIVFSTVAALVGYIAVPFFVFYALKDRDFALGRFYALFPPGVQADVRECVRIANRVFGAYVRAQLFLGLVIFVITYIGLRLMGVEFALALAVVAGFTELIPIIGPVIGAVPALIVVLATEPEHWWWIVLFYLGVQAAENYFLVPRVHSHSVSMHPVMVLLLISIGGAIYGLWGVLLIVPIAAAARDVFVYIYRRLAEEERRLADMVTDPAPEM